MLEVKVTSRVGGDENMVDDVDYSYGCSGYAPIWIEVPP